VPRYSSPLTAPPPAGQQPGRVLRAAALTAVIVGVLVLAAAAFVLSYSGIHAVAQQAGISAPLARGYPVIFDAMLVVTCAAVLALRGAGVVSKCYAWLSLVILLGATAGADALHATGTVVSHRTAALVAAILPWILLLIGFGLLLAMLRHFRLHRAAPPAAVPEPAREARRPAGPPAALPPPAATPPVTVPPQASGDFRQPPGQPGGTSGGTASRPAPGQQDVPDEPDPAHLDNEAPDSANPAEVPEEIFAAPAAAEDPDAPAAARPQPAFHRMWSSPTPPGDEDDG
jgi:hypothetical protein